MYVKALHIICVISWMAGLLYLPRLFVYHTETKFGNPDYNRFLVMERKLYSYIATPAMLLALLTGLWLALVGEAYTQIWFHIKASMLILLIMFHLYCHYIYNDFIKGVNKRSKTFLKIINEIPTIMMIVIVFVAVVKTL